MALVECKECHAMVSSAATGCPKCGCPPPKIIASDDLPIVTTQQTSKIYKGMQLAGVLLIIAGVVACNTAPSANGYNSGLIIFCGLALYVFGRFSAWWNNG